jgi:hypothetical protein
VQLYMEDEKGKEKHMRSIREICVALEIVNVSHNNVRSVCKYPINKSA